MAEQQEQETELKKLFVGNLPFTTIDQDLQMLFAQAGTVISAQVVTDRFSAQSKGFAFVEMSSAEEAQTAIKMFDGKEYSGRTLAVKEALRRPSKPRLDDETTGSDGETITEESLISAVEQPMPKIFISYRRQDSGHLVDQIRRYLQTQFGESSVLPDLADIPTGMDFRKVLEQHIEQCNVMVVIIGPQWTNILDAEGNKRLFDPNDFTRLEVETGLQRKGIVVLPFLVMDANMPSVEELPSSLEGLVHLNITSVRSNQELEQGIHRLARTLRLSIWVTDQASDEGKDINSSYGTVNNNLNINSYKINSVANASSAQTAKSTVYISRASNGVNEEIINQIDKELRSRSIITIPFRGDLVGIAGSIQRFMEGNDRNSCVVVIMDDQYLRSLNCMSELVVIAENEQFYDRVFPIVLADANIYDPSKGIKYVKLWEAEKSKLILSTQQMDPANSANIRKEIDLFNRIGNTLANLPRILSDMKTLIPEVHKGSNFSQLYDDIKKRLRISENPEAEKVQQLQVAIAANMLTNNRSQAVFNDRAQGEDQLGIKDEVEALAETLLLRDVEPPVAVGIMGGWGSGKSFVMYLISKYIEQTRCKIVKRGWSTQEKDPGVPAYVGHVYQINFNAWTYAKSNLWASLMDTIFINLNRQMQIEQLLAHRDCSPKDTINLAEDVRKSMLAGGKDFAKIYGESLRFDQDKELEPWKENLEYWAHHLFKGNLLWSVMRRRQEENLDRLKDTEEQLKQLKSQRDQFEKSRSPEKKNINLDPASAKACAQTMLTALAAFIPEQVGKTAVQTLEQQHVTEEDIRQALKDTWEVKGLIDTIFGMFREYKILRLLTLLFLLLGIILLTFPLPSVDLIQRRTAAVVSFIATALPFVSASLIWWQKVASFNAKAKVILEDAYKNQQAKQAEEIANSTKKSPTQKIADLQKEVSQGSIAAYDTLINLLEAQAETERQLIGPSAKYSSLMEFVQSRLDAATYENQLGLMHQVRQDIDELTYSLADGAREDVFPRGKPRVILYIDDLDRCPPQRVVEILEAVQLLLNTKLFVIILGLDTRYVTRALEKEYKEILQHEGDPSGLDYIEKIIQIPYRVRPIEQDSLQKYLVMQMDVEKPPEPEPEPVVQTAQRDVPVQSTPLAEPQPQAESTASTPPAAEEPVQAPTATEPVKAADEKEPEPEQPKLPEVELPAAIIQFKHEDLLDLTACCQQIPLSPRSIKRLVNVFKLIKIFWFRADKEADIAGRDQPRPVKQAAMCMLALSSAYPEVMREVFVHLEGLYRQGKERSVLFTELNSIKLPPGSAHDMAWQLQKYKSDVSTLKLMAGDEQDKLSQLTLKDFKLSTFNIVRSFSFVGDPMYWTDGEENTSRANGQNQTKPPLRTKRSKKKTTKIDLTDNLDANGGK